MSDAVDLIPCGCKDLGYTADMDWFDLTAMLKRHRTCSDPLWVCPNIDKLLRRADVIRQREHQYNKRKKREGYTDTEIKTKPKGVKRIAEVDLNAIL